MARQRMQQKAAEYWGAHHDMSAHEAYENPRFRKLWNSFQREPTDYKRRSLGIPEYRKKGEKEEQRQLALQRMFGDSPP